MKSVTTYSILWFTVGFISAIDIYWAITLQDVLMEIELNPLGRFLIEISDGDIALFMFYKVIGLVVVLGILTILYNYRRRIAWASILGVCIFQLWLLWYLNAVGPSASKKTEFYHQVQEQKPQLEVMPCPPMIIHADPAKSHLRQNIDLMTLPTPVPNVEEENLIKSSTSHP